MTAIPAPGQEQIMWAATQRRIDLALIANAAVSDHPEPTQTEREHAAMARRLLELLADKEEHER